MCKIENELFVYIYGLLRKVVFFPAFISEFVVMKFLHVYYIL